MWSAKNSKYVAFYPTEIDARQGRKSDPKLRYARVQNVIQLRPDAVLYGVVYEVNTPIPEMLRINAETGMSSIREQYKAAWQTIRMINREMRRCSPSLYLVQITDIIGKRRAKLYTPVIYRQALISYYDREST